MTTYKGIKGLGIQSVTADAVASKIEGGSWSSGGDLNTQRFGGVGAGVSRTSAIMVSGNQGPPGSPSGPIANTEIYNGSAWTETGDVSVAFNYSNGFGTTTAMIVGGKDTSSPLAPQQAVTESFNGTSWSNPSASINTNRFIGGSCGTSTAGIVFGGQVPGARDEVETWDGTSWTETTDLNTAKQKINTGTGTQTAALSAGGLPATTEEWNGSSWTEIADPNTNRLTAGKSGIVTAALMFGGTPEPAGTAATEYWNGSTWTEIGDLGTQRSWVQPAGSGQPGANANSLCFIGQNTSGTLASTEEWDAPAVFRQFNVGDIYYNADPSSGVLKYVGYGTGAWASGGTMGTTRAQAAAAGTQTASILAGGIPNSVNAETYNGTAWTEVANLNTGRTLNMGGGTQTAAISAGGNTTAAVDNVESWNGSSWTETTEINTARTQGGGTGKSQSAVLIVGGEGSPFADQKAKTEIWNGSGWTEVGDLNDGRTQITAFGTSTSALGTSGHPGSGTTANAETWDGSSWTEVANLNQSREGAMSAGNSSSYGIACGGRVSPTYYNNTEIWNGSSWTEVANLGTALYNGSMAGTGNVAIMGGGSASGTGGTTGSEEWTTPEALKTLASTNA